MAYFTKALGAAAALSVGIGFWASEAHALTNLGTFSGTDCSGSGGFPNCYATQSGVVQGPVQNGSPTIYKFNYSNGAFAGENSGNFASITGAEFTTLSYVGNVLSFVYTAGANDPLIKYFAIKQGSSYNLFYDAGGITQASINLGTLGYNGLSHITFFDTGAGGGTGGDGGSGGAVPEPATWAMMLIGFGLMGAAMRRRHQQGANVRFAF